MSNRRVTVWHCERGREEMDCSEWETSVPVRRGSCSHTHTEGGRGREEWKEREVGGEREEGGERDNQ